MQQRARFSLRQAGLLALVAIGLGPGCSQDGPVSDEEMAQLRQFTLPAEGLPPDPSNAYGDHLEAAQLGKLLFFEPRFSGRLGPYNVFPTNGALGNVAEAGKVSCASCHDPLTAGADRRSLPPATSLGVSYTHRNAPTVINAAYSPLWQFWDGRADSLWSQALSPPEGPAECGGTRLGVALALYDHYRTAFEYVFGAGAMPDDLKDTSRFPARPARPGDRYIPSLEDRKLVNTIYANFGKAIAAYERRLVSTAFEPSPFDAFMAGDASAMSPAAIRGARLFVGRAGCAECHSGSMFSDFAFHNIGVPQTGQYPPATDGGRLDGLYGGENVLTNIFNRAGEFSDDKSITNADHLQLTQPPRLTIGQFKTPSLRNVSKTAPYMHDGVYQTLWDVVNHYNFGGSTGPYSGTKDPALAPLLLTDAEMGDLVEFLRALDDGRVKQTDDFPEGLLAQPTLPL
jgi:cytochrome c peroxidase